jgi:hypothetical protein
MTVMQKTNSIDLTRLKQGQVITRKYFELSDRISLIFGSPKTDFIHYAIIGVPAENRDDWLTFNARVRGGVEMLPLRRFKGQTVRIYSVLNALLLNANIKSNLGHKNIKLCYSPW